MLEKIKQLTGKVPGVESPLDDFEEDALVSIALDCPDYFVGIVNLINPEMFSRYQIRYIMGHILNYYEKYKLLPTRRNLERIIKGHFTADMLDEAEVVLELVSRPLNPRDLPSVKDSLHKWARKQTLGLLYSDEMQAAWHRGDYERLEEVFAQASRITEVGTSGFWFFEQLEELFQPDATEHLPTGYRQLDRALEGGPAPSEVLCWMAATGVGKCHTLQTKIYERRLSRIYELEDEDGGVRRLAGYRIVRTARGEVRVCDLVEGDDIVELPADDDSPDLRVQVV